VGRAWNRFGGKKRCTVMALQKRWRPSIQKDADGIADTKGLENTRIGWGAPVKNTSPGDGSSFGGGEERGGKGAEKCEAKFSEEKGSIKRSEEESGWKGKIKQI